VTEIEAEPFVGTGLGAIDPMRIVPVDALSSRQATVSPAT
jgi:hypothetical protein